MTPPRHFQLADLFEIVADAIGDKPWVITPDAEHTYAQVDERATRLANHLASQGIGAGDRVGIHAMNCVEWLEAFFACFKISAVPVNVNYRYVAAELRYLYGNAECSAIIVAPEYGAAVDEVAPDLPGLRYILELGEPYEAALAAASPERCFAERSENDLYLLYTGGTTGMPKGVMWRNEDIIFAAMNSGRGGRPLERPEDLGVEVAAAPGQARMMAIGPLMHGGSQWAMGNGLLMGGVLVLATFKRFDAHQIWEFAARTKVNSISTMGDAMARPLAEALLEEGRPDYDLSSFFTIGNGGAPLSAGVRAQLKQALPNLIIMDSFGASETGATGSKMDQGEGLPSPRFQMGPHTTVLDQQGNQCAVGQTGRLARTGHIPLGYWRDEAKTAETFPVYHGTRWVIPGDHAVIEQDGSISLLGRGSVCINTGGEKVYPEEVEAALKTHPAVFDAVVVGVPHPRWGEQVTALVQLRPGHSADEASIVAQAKTLVADYKAPKVVVTVPVVQRTAVGKADYKWAKEEALKLVG